MISLHRLRLPRAERRITKSGQHRVFLFQNTVWEGAHAYDCQQAAQQWDMDVIAAHFDVALASNPISDITDWPVIPM